MGFLFRRLSFYVVAFFVAATINFFLPRMMPGDPFQIMFGEQIANMTEMQIAELRANYGFVDASLISQYFSYITSVFSWDLGVSLKHFPKPVTEVLAESLPWTLFLVGTSTFLSFTIGSLFGVVASWFRGSAFDVIATPLSLVMQAVPQFVICLAALILFGNVLGWLPTSYAFDPDLDIAFNWTFISSVIHHAILPVGTLMLFQMAGFLIPMRANMINILGEDYITMAKGKGLSIRQVMFNYGARNALLPSVTTLALALGFVVGGSFITEVIFNYPGIGYKMFQAIQNQDYPLLQGHMLLFTLVMLSANFIADLIYVFLDPRAGEGGSK